MQAALKLFNFRWFADFRLVIGVHWDAFRSDPATYLTAAKWWALRKRVRARGMLAPLLSQSSNAYLLWAIRVDQLDRSQSLQDGLPPIIALVSATIQGQTEPEMVSATLASLADEGVPAIIISDNKKHDLANAADAINWSERPWLMPIEAGDLLAPGAASAYRTAMGDPALHLLYADDDELDRWKRRASPHFKPDWNSELFRHFDYLTGGCIVRCDAAGLVRSAEQCDWAAAIVANAAAAGPVQHVRRMLHHRKSRRMPPVAAAPLDVAPDLPLVTIVIPTRNRVDLLRTCLDGVAATTYPRVEVIIIDNDSDEPATLQYLASLDPKQARVLRHPGPFNYSKINNWAVAEARGRLLCLLNNDIEVTTPDWLAIMATQALRDDVGAVGAQLLYPDGRIQHAGVVIGVGNAAGHAHRFVHPQKEGYFRRHALPQFTAAVTAACLVVARDRFLAVGGLDERNFAVAFNDVDLCMRLNQRGWQSFYEPRATLIHHESVSRGLDRDPVGAARFAGELASLKRIWKTDHIVDPFHHPQLSRASEQFSVAI